MSIAETRPTNLHGPKRLARLHGALSADNGAVAAARYVTVEAPV